MWPRALQTLGPSAAGVHHHHHHHHCSLPLRRPPTSLGASSGFDETGPAPKTLPRARQIEHWNPFARAHLCRVSEVGGIPLPESACDCARGGFCQHTQQRRVQMAPAAGKRIQYNAVAAPAPACPSAANPGSEPLDMKGGRDPRPGNAGTRARR
jgi:hypothetical protein